MTPERSRLFSRARQWLDQLVGAAVDNNTRRPEVLGRVLLGFWICDSLTATTQDAFPAVARRIGDALNKEDLDWSKTAPALKLIVASLLSSQQVFVPFLHSEEGFLHRAVIALKGSPPVDARTDILLCEKRVLLHALGLHARPDRIDFSELRDFARALPLTDPQSYIEELLLLIHSYTLFGAGGSVALKPSDDWIAELLTGLAMTFFRKYDLLMGCRILRALNYLVGDPKAIDTGLDFLGLQQRIEGSFGFFSPEGHGLLNAAAEQFSLEVDLTLPITIDCLWTIGEGSHPGWRLYQTLPQVSLTMDELELRI